MYAPIIDITVQQANPPIAPSIVLLGDAAPAALLTSDSLFLPNFLPMKYAPTSGEHHRNREC